MHGDWGQKSEFTEGFSSQFDYRNDMENLTKLPYRGGGVVQCGKGVNERYKSEFCTWGGVRAE